MTGATNTKGHVTVLHLSHYMPRDHGTHRDFIAPWAARVMEACPELSIEIHSEGSDLGLLENQYDQVLSGRVDIAHSPASLPPDRFPLTNLVNLPFSVKDAGEAGARLWAAHDAILAQEFAPLHVLALHADSGGVLHLRQGGLRDIDDLRGLRIRSPRGPVAELLRDIGAVPVPILPPRIGEAARKGEIDGALMAWDVLEYTATQDVFRHHYDSVFYVSPLYLVMNAHSRERLSAAAKEAIDQASGGNLAPRFGRYWQGWSASGRALAELPGHVVEPLPDNILTTLKARAEPGNQRHVAALVAAGHDRAADAFAILSGTA